MLLVLIFVLLQYETAKTTGADQLAAAHLCYRHAKQWLAMENSENAQNGFLKVQKKYLTVSTTHILYLHDLGKSQYLQLVLQPVELIHAIYNDPRILQRNTGNIICFPKINEAVESIGRLHAIDVFQIQLELLEEWLQPENFIRNVSFDESMIVQPDIHNSSLHSSKADQENLQRACYILEINVTKFAPFLANIVFDQNQDDVKPLTVRLRALHCLCSVISENQLEDIVSLDAEYIRNFKTNLLFVTELESIGLAYSIQGFAVCDKSELAQSLLTRNNTASVRLAASICQMFDIQAPSIWNNILFRMINLNMVKELSNVLPYLLTCYHQLDENALQNAWNITLIVPLTKARQTLTEEEESIIEKSIESIYCCPIIDRIDIKKIRDNCLRINRVDLANKVQFFIE